MKPTTIRLGYTVGSGDPVDIPLKHLVITGQTQEAGKTTALEALIARSGLRAVTFITKRGEGSFTSARRVQPYFRDAGDWQFVSSILEASRGEKLKFERAWIIRASKGATTLAQVQRNVREAMKTAKGMSADVYLTLDAYLDVVVPTIGRIDWAPGLDLRDGINAVDLSDLPDEMQHLVIRSSLSWVLNREHDTVVVVPEAWKFLPQGRGTPVKLAAEAYIRQGAGLRNFLWLDSQDIAGVEKIILKSCPLWILGVQREANEVKRTLDNIPAGIGKPTAADVAQLELGQFYACWNRHAIKTYVQPAWLHEDAARAVAQGRTMTAREIEVHRSGRGAIPAKLLIDRGRGETVTKDEAARLTRENAQLKTELEKLREKVEVLTRVNKQFDERIAPTMDKIADHIDERTRREAPTRSLNAPETAPRNHEELYEAIKARLVAEAPALIRLLATKPELEVTIERPVLEFEPHSLKWRLVRLLAEGFFETERKSPSQIRGALKRTGPDANTANIGRAMDDMVKVGVFTDEGSGYLAVPGIAVKVNQR